jgi:hypothetical protein
MGETAALAVLDVEETSAVSRDGRDEPLFIETLAELSAAHAEYRTNTAACSEQSRLSASVPSNRSRDAL